MKIQKQYKKIYKIYNDIINFLPKEYPHGELQVYKTLRGLLLFESKVLHCSYKELVNHYEVYFKQNKYSDSDIVKYNKKEGIKNLTALVGLTDIYVCYETTKRYAKRNYVYLFLHELGHMYNKKYGRINSEVNADKFALKWYLKIKRKELIK